MINPRKTFRDNASLKDWQKTVDSALFEQAATAALCEMQLNQNTAGEPIGAAAQHWRLEGARAYLKILMSLADSEVKPVSKNHQNLER